MNGVLDQVTSNTSLSLSSPIAGNIIAKAFILCMGDYSIIIYSLKIRSYILYIILSVYAKYNDISYKERKEHSECS